MYSFDRFVKDFFRLFDCFISKKYVTEDNRFIRDRKMTQRSILPIFFFKEVVRLISRRLDFLQ